MIDVDDFNQLLEDPLDEKMVDDWIIKKLLPNFAEGKGFNYEDIPTRHSRKFLTELKSRGFHVTERGTHQGCFFYVYTKEPR